MSLLAIKILNFRNYERLELGDFGNFNILAGNNGSGKTNFLEAVFTLSLGKPFRKVSMEDLIEWGANSFYIGGTFDRVRKEIGYHEQKKALRIDNSPASAPDFTRASPVLAFLPDDLE